MDWLEKTIEALLVFCVLFLFFLLYLLVIGFNAPSFSLAKDDWQCTQESRHTRMMLVGKVVVPQIYTQCDQWSRK